ncbi:MAG: FtsW/RodA/SpoVE family cell cycle protein [Lachnospiraceae bacterium]
MEVFDKVFVKKKSYFDYQTLFLVLFLVGFGLVMIYSTSSYKGSLDHGDPAYWLTQQATRALLGIVLMIIVSNIDYRRIKDTDYLTMAGYLGANFLLLLTLLVATATKGSKRWLKLGPVQLQPSEIAKVAIILFMAHYIYRYANKLKDMKGTMSVAIWALPTIIMVGVENMSTAIIIFAIVGIMIFVASPRYKQFVILGGVGVAGMTLFLVAGYRQERIQVWLDPENHEKGLQTMQALYAIGSGGLFGKGLGQSMQKMGFIPESHNDMIFSIICEELGLFGSIGIIFVFILLLWRFMVIAMNAPDLYGSLIVVGVIAHIGIQVFMNIAVVTNTIPPTGIPLPFISYGGTSLVFLLLEVGLVLSVSRQIKLQQ